MVEVRKPTFCGLPYVPRRGIPCDMTDAATYPDIGHRLANIRRGFSDLTQTEWAKRHNFAVTQYNNWEKGARRIPVEAAARIVRMEIRAADGVQDFRAGTWRAVVREWSAY